MSQQSSEKQKATAQLIMYVGALWLVTLGGAIIGLPAVREALQLDQKNSLIIGGALIFVAVADAIIARFLIGGQTRK